MDDVIVHCVCVGEGLGREGRGTYGDLNSRIQ